MLAGEVVQDSYNTNFGRGCPAIYSTEGHSATYTDILPYFFIYEWYSSLFARLFRPVCLKIEYGVLTPAFKHYVLG